MPRISKLVGTDSVRWRYDPIFLSERYTAEYHLHAFRQIAESLKRYTKTVVISFIDLYPKVRKNFPEVREVSKADRLKLGKEMIKIATECACYLSCDIGAYNTCLHLCKYCYANAEPGVIYAQNRLHDPASPFLIGNYEDGDKIHEVGQKSWIDRQERMFLA